MDSYVSINPLGYIDFLVHLKQRGVVISEGQIEGDWAEQLTAHTRMMADR